jgi:hypothetical protein
MLTPALGVGATAATFTLVSAVLVGNLSVTDSKSLVRLVVLLVAVLFASLIPARRATFIGLSEGPQRGVNEAPCFPV